MPGPSADAADPTAFVAPVRSSLLQHAGVLCALLYGVTLAHLIVQRLFLGASESPTALQFLWQIPSVAEMSRLPWQSIWYWHAYPSGFVAYWVLLVKLFGGHGAGLACGWIYLFASAALTPTTYLIALAVCRSRTASLAAAVVLGASPTLPLFAAYYLYDTPTTVLVTGVVAGVAMYQLSGRRVGWLVAALWLAGLLVFVRALYHLVVLVPLVVAIVRARPGRAWLAGAGAALVLPGAMYLKNLLIFGFFGSSSMIGFNYSKMVLWALPPEQIAYFREAGDVAPMVADYPLFYHMITGPQLYRDYGYTATGPSAVLNQNDANNVNLVAVSREYGRSARAVLAHDPWAIVTPVSLAYYRFCSPPSRSAWFRRSPARIGPYRDAYLNVFYGEGLGPPLDRLTGWGRMPSLVMPLLPLLLGGFLAWQIAVCRLSWRKWRDAALGQATLYILMAFMLYTVTLSSLLEVNENDRYFTYIEPLFVVATAAAIVAVFRGVRSRFGATPAGAEPT